MLAAEGAPPFRCLIDPDHVSFLSPHDMRSAIAQFCRETAQPVPVSEGEVIRCVLESLAMKYAAVLDSLTELTGHHVGAVNIVGGGSRNRLLNQFTANACKLPVHAGPVEATVLGNVLVQARANRELDSLADIRRVARESSEVETVEPARDSTWDEAQQLFADLCCRPRGARAVAR